MERVNAAHRSPDNRHPSLLPTRRQFGGLVLAAAGGLLVRPQLALAGNEWARKMFKVSEHDFGTVARASKSEFVFEFENSYEETVHVAGVRTSCGCTTATIVKDTLKTWEKGGILAVFNTQSFLGHRSATITVTIDRPFYAEVQLNVQGYIRSDVVFSPGLVDFGAVDQGGQAKRKVMVNYAGRSDWQVTDVRSANSNFEVELNEVSRTPGKVAYEMFVYLKPGAPEGFFQDQLVLVSNDARSGNVPIVVEGRVVPAITVSPGSLLLGVLQPGQSVTKQLIVKGKQPFKIMGVKCPDERLEFKVPESEKNLQVIPITFTAGEAAEKLTTSIEIETTLGMATAKATATINKPKD